MCGNSKVMYPFFFITVGCSLDEKLLPLPVDAECTCLGFEGKLYCMAYARVSFCEEKF